jgi:hypothetical protein
MEPDLRRAFVLRVALGQVATLPFIAAGIAVLAGGLGGLFWLAAAMVFLDPCGVIRRMGAAHRDQPVGEGED